MLTRVYLGLFDGHLQNQWPSVLAHISQTSLQQFYHRLSELIFQRELSIIDFTLNYPPIRNNLTSASLLSMLIETDYLNYPPIRNNLTSASLLSVIIEMDYNLLGMKARTVPRCRSAICRARNIFFLSRSTKRCNSVFFSLCHLQIVLLTIANTKIHYFLPK